MTNIYKCPTCLGSFIETPDKLTCKDCNSQFIIEEGIPLLRQNKEVFYGEFSRDEMRKLLDDSLLNIESALSNLLRNKKADRRLGEYIMGHGRAGWKFLLPTSSNATVLDLGCGWGGISYNMAQSCKLVVAMDSTLERMQFLQLRAKKQKRENIMTVCAGDSAHLPFDNNMFDIIILNGVLEWVPSGVTGDPKQVQIKFLKEVSRILKPEGVLFLAIENRNAWKTWFLFPDGHTGLRFVSWLPRKMANLYSIIMGKGEYRNYLYSRNQYKKLLNKTGLKHSEFYVPVPGYHHPNAMIQADDYSNIHRKVSRSTNNFLQGIKQFIKGCLAARFPDAYAIVTGSEENNLSFLQRLIKEIANEFQSFTSDVELKDYRINGEMGMVTIVLGNTYKDKNGYVLRLPLHDRAKHELLKEFDNSRKIHNGSHALSTHKNLIPEVFNHSVLDGQDYFLYELKHGVNGDDLSGNFRTKALACMEEFAINLIRDTQIESISNETECRKHINSLVATVLPLANNSLHEKNLFRLESLILDYFENNSLPMVMGHGDYKLANGLFNKASGEMTAILDWGAAFDDVLAFYDLSFLLADYMNKYKGLPLIQILDGWIRNDESIEWIKKRLVNLSEKTDLHINDQLFVVLGAYQWLQRMAPLGSGYEACRYDYKLIDGHFDILSNL